LSNFFASISTQFGRTIKVVQCDNGREFDNASSHAFFASSGVILRMSCPHTSPQNGKAERSLHTINNMIRSLLFQASMPTHYWVEGLHTTTYLLNHLPCKAINISCPYITLYDVAPSYEHLHVFGCVCYPNLFAQAATNWPSGPLVVSSSDTPLITKVIGVLISLPTISLSPDMLFLTRKSFSSLSHPI
jgi:hypothetical protein